MTENDLIKLYCIVDDFYHMFIKTECGKKNLEFYYGKRGPARRMTIPEVVTLNLARSITSMFRHFFYSISAFLFHKVESVHKWFLPNLIVQQKLEF